MPYDAVREQAYNKKMRARVGAMYDPAEYQQEKLLGKRSITGELKLKRLNGAHRRIISLHARCLSNRDISFVTGYSEIAISRIVRDPLSQIYLNELLEGVEHELKALMPLATDAIRNGLQSDNIKTAMVAADKFFRATGHYQHEENVGRETAEDVIGRALAIMEKQAGALKELSRPERPRALDVDFEEVKDGNDSDSGNEALKRLP